jgi:hypothetical protein
MDYILCSLLLVRPYESQCKHFAYILALTSPQRPTDLAVYWASSTARYSVIGAKGTRGLQNSGGRNIICASSADRTGGSKIRFCMAEPLTERGWGFQFRGTIIVPVSVTLVSSDIANRSDWLGAGRPRGWSSSHGGGQNFHFSAASRPALGSEPTRPPIQWVPGLFHRG